MGVFAIHLPPLRERGEDLPMLTQHYLRRFSRDLGREVQELAPEALRRLRSYSWPGNIRELQSTLKQALLRASGPVLVSAFLPDVLGEPCETGLSSQPENLSLEAYIREQLRPDNCNLYAEAHNQLDRFLLCPWSWTTRLRNRGRRLVYLGSPAKLCA